MKYMESSWATGDAPKWKKNTSSKQNPHSTQPPPRTNQPTKAARIKKSGQERTNRSHQGVLTSGCQLAGYCPEPFPKYLAPAPPPLPLFGLPPRPGLKTASSEHKNSLTGLNPIIIASCTRLGEKPPEPAEPPDVVDDQGALADTTGGGARVVEGEVFVGPFTEGEEIADGPLTVAPLGFATEPFKACPAGWEPGPLTTLGFVVAPW
eukprot:gnl/TRDRNA2_/TRDRNA2_173617_c0_seq4.p2 gnl/TRDRNA2_/TRDRNA2_173617_c0~~gnl/TRDRNA2_/TRDRNA2_173617_c0_seq4.p2  ORF type:complete len:207 (-),score=13.48 gnl/TRDRNA2_/TRDRNA2_173617_c0_seq4:454-1074(-)